MAENIFNMLNQVFLLMRENKLRNDIDDTLFEKLLTLFERYKCEGIQTNDETSTNTGEIEKYVLCDFVEELLKKTNVLELVEITLKSVSENTTTILVTVKTFVIRFLCLIFESPKELYSVNSLSNFLLFKDKNGKIRSYIPSIEDALLSLLLSIIKKLDGIIWFKNENLEEFVFSSFNSSSYYVRKTAVKLFVNFISQWSSVKVSQFQDKETQFSLLEDYFKNIMLSIIKQIHHYSSSEDMRFAECCILVTTDLLSTRSIENIIGPYLRLAENISQCFTKLPDDDKFNKILVDLLLLVFDHCKSKVADKVIYNVLQSLILKENVTLAFYLASSYAKLKWPKDCTFDEIKFFLLPIYIMQEKPAMECEFFDMKSEIIYNIMLEEMDSKPKSKSIFSSSLSSLENIFPLLDFKHQELLVIEIFNIIKMPAYKYLFILDDRIVHHSFVELFTALLSQEDYPFSKQGEIDFIFQMLIEFLKKPTSDVNFLSQLLLLLKDNLMLHEKYEYKLVPCEKNCFVEIVSRMLLDKREAVVDSAIHLAGQILNNSAWKEDISKHGIHSIIWDIAIHGSHDGSVRSTALKVAIESCLETWCFNEIKVLKDVSEVNVLKILFLLTQDPDFFLQREGLSCLYLWIKSNWSSLSPYSCYLFSALISAIKSLDLEMKLLSLNIWLWYVQQKFPYPTNGNFSEIQDYINQLAKCGFGLTLKFALEDYDDAVRFKAADILFQIQNRLITSGLMYSNFKTDLSNEEVNNIYENSNYSSKIFTRAEKDIGIDNVMELSTTEQITIICKTIAISENSAMDTENFTLDSEDRSCPFEVFWRCLWSENLSLILQSNKKPINSDAESLLNDIIAAKTPNCYSIEDTPDCY